MGHRVPFIFLQRVRDKGAIPACVQEPEVGGANLFEFATCEVASQSLLLLSPPTLSAMVWILTGCPLQDWIGIFHPLHLWEHTAETCILQSKTWLQHFGSNEVSKEWFSTNIAVI